MASPTMANVEAANSLKERLSAFLARYSVDGLVRSGDLGPELNFAAGSFYFERLLHLFAELNDRDLSLLSRTKINAITQRLGDLDQLFERIRSFSVSTNPSNPQGVRQGHLDQLATFYDLIFDLIVPIVTYLAIDTGLLARAKDEALAFVKEISNERQTSANLYKDLEGLLKSSQETAKKLGIVEHAKDFQNEADNHKRASWAWLLATTLAMAAVLYFGYLNYSATSDALNNAMMYGKGRTTNDVPLSLTVQFALAKLVIFSILISGVLWCGRVYKAHRHNFVVNKHRVNALNSFSTFAKAAGEDQQIKNAVLLQATQCIYTPQATGFVVGESESESSTKILELFRDVSKP